MYIDSKPSLYLFSIQGDFLVHQKFSISMSKTSCFGGLLECCQGPSFTATASYAQLQEATTVQLDMGAVGSDVVIVKNGHRLCGTGAALCNAPIMQDKAYFECKVQQTGQWGVGLAAKSVDLNDLPIGKCSHSWVLRDDSVVYTGDNTLGSVEPKVEEGDILVGVGISYDHTHMSFYKNGQPTGTMISGIKGKVYPIFYVADGAILDVKFNFFWHDPPPGFEQIMMEQTIL